MPQEYFDAISRLVENKIGCIHTAFPGKIVEYDGGKAKVQPLILYRKKNKETMEYPLLTGVPVLFPQCMDQKATIAYPVKPGDQCLVIISEQPLDYWLFGMETDTNLYFDITEAVCIPGVFNRDSSVMKEAIENDAIIVDRDGTRITVKKNLVQIDSEEVIINGDVTINGTLNTTGNIETEEDAIASDVSLVEHTHTGDSGGTTSPPL